MGALILWGYAMVEQAHDSSPFLTEHAAQRAKTPPSLVEESRSFAFKRNLNAFVAAPFMWNEDLDDSGQIFHSQGTHNFFFFVLLLLCVDLAPGKRSP